MIALLVMTDGRAACLARTIARFEEMVVDLELVTRRVIHVDGEDRDFARWVVESFGDRYEVIITGRRSGFGGAIASAWATLHGAEEPFVFHLEDDFLLERPLALAELMFILDARPSVAQVALRRQPWNDAERAAGSLVERWGRANFVEREADGVVWLEHRVYFTTNPSLYRRELIAGGWPTGAQSEGRFGIELLEDPDLRFGMIGGLDDPPWVTHIGDDRIGTGY